MGQNLDNAKASMSGGARGSGLAARLGLFDATMIVMGGIVGSGIFINPYVVAEQVHTRALILSAWVIGGAIALGGAFIWAELAAVMPRVGGQYAYLREAYHPSIAFLYGWVLLLVIQTGGMAAVAVTFAKYFLELTAVHISSGLTATLTLGILTAINCLGVRAGSTVQSALMVLKIVAIGALVSCGAVFLAHHSPLFHGPVEGRPNEGYPPSDRPLSFGLLTAMGAALVPVLFSYGGWQTANFVAEEVREPRRNLPRALVIGVLGVILLYLSVNFVCVYSLGPRGLAGTMTPASAVMRLALGSKGAALIAVGIAISALGFLSQSILTAPRVYFAMAEDGLFFRSVGWLDPRHRVPVVAIALQGVAAIVIALSGRYDQILSYVVSMDFLFFGLTATCVFVFRRDGKRPGEKTESSGLARMPGHPLTTFVFVAACWLVVINTIFRYPRNTAVGFGILFAGIPVYFLWRRQKRRRRTT
jgi:basic amino acid/polyamine antiporter, APA family